jgi:isopentenyl diphosphate isomerase/L-lactate dehydrogenase-like FMN-dependent dehydrogenase
MSLALKDAYNVEDFRTIAKARLPKGLFEFIDRGTEDEQALDNNRLAYSRYCFAPRTLVDVSKRSAATQLFGKSMTMPVAVAPTGAAGLMWYDGEVALARAAAAAGIPFTVATGSLAALERVAEQAGGRLWFQLYMYPDKAMSYDLVERARAAQYEALIVTVDTAVPSNREYNFRNGFSIPFKFSRKNVQDVALHPGWLASVLARYLLTTGMPKYENHPRQFRSSITAKPIGRAVPKSDSLEWDDLRELRKVWPGILMIKGILRPEDAVRAIDCGVDGIIVSNHGGRMLDCSVPPLTALPAIADRVRGRVPVIVDSGIRRGSDVVKALALGASATMVGRATLYGLAADGQQGASRVLALLHEEVVRVMGLTGCPTVGQIGPDCLHGYQVDQDRAAALGELGRPHGLAARAER